MQTHTIILASLLVGGIALGQVVPVLNGEPTVVGKVSDPQLNRDSCGSALFGARTLWTCRDTQMYFPNGTLNIPSISSTASWSNLTSDGGPDVEAENVDGYPGLLLMYGDEENSPFYVYGANECGNSTSGTCSDGTRYAIWPDSPPMVVSGTAASVVAYTWIRNEHITGLTPLVSDPSVTLYRLDYTPSGDVDTLPTVTLVDQEFWGEGQLDYGTYGNVVFDGTAYLYSDTSNGQIALARVAAGSVEDKASYEFWVNGGWTATQPSIDSSGINLNATAGGQGTFYYSQSWQSFVWIGQANESVSADFFIATAPQPQGPWTAPEHFYSGVNGNASLPAYSLQAHPDLVPSGENAIYLTYTKNDHIDGNDIYTTPLIYAEWQDS